MKCEESDKIHQIMISLLVVSVTESQGRFAVLIFPAGKKIKRCEGCCILIDPL